MCIRRAVRFPVVDERSSRRCLTPERRPAATVRLLDSVQFPVVFAHAHKWTEMAATVGRFRKRDVTHPPGTRAATREYTSPGDPKITAVEPATTIAIDRRILIHGWSIGQSAEHAWRHRPAGSRVAGSALAATRNSGCGHSLAGPAQSQMVMLERVVRVLFHETG